MNNLNILKQLSEAFGPSGFEEEVNTIISNEFNSLNSFKRNEDGLGSVIFSKHVDSSLPVISLVAHMDEIGYLVKYIDDNGFIKVQNLGGWLSQAMINQRWIIRTDNKDIIGGVNLVLTKNGIETGKYIGNPIYLKKGIAKLAVLAFFDFLKDLLPSDTEIFVRTKSENFVNVALNEKLGYKIISEIDKDGFILMGRVI